MRHRLTEHLRILTDNFRPVPLCFRFGPDNGYRLRVANDLETRRRAYRLVYQMYLERGYACPQPSEMWVTAHDALPETVTLFVEHEGRTVAALTAVPDSPLGLPADELYSQELNTLRRQGRRLCEVISFGVNLDVNDSLILGRLFRGLHTYAYRIARQTDFVVTVTPRHARYYRRLLCFEGLGPEKAHPRVRDTVGCLERLPLTVPDAATPEGRRAHLCRNLYQLCPAEREAELIEVIRKGLRPMTERELQYFFVEQSDIFLRARPAHLAYLAERYLPYNVLSSLNTAPTAEVVMA